MKMQYLKNVVSLKVNSQKCTNCGICLDVCPREVLKKGERQLTIIALDSCIECGACQINCPFDAITVKAGVGCASAYINNNGKCDGAECCC